MNHQVLQNLMMLPGCERASFPGAGKWLPIVVRLAAVFPQLYLCLGFVTAVAADQVFCPNVSRIEVLGECKLAEEGLVALVALKRWVVLDVALVTAQVGELDVAVCALNVGHVADNQIQFVFDWVINVELQEK